MAKKPTAKKKEKSFEETLWDAANKLRGSVNRQNTNTLY